MLRLILPLLLVASVGKLRLVASAATGNNNVILQRRRSELFMPRHTNYKDLHKLEGHKATFKCQLFDGSMWNRCEWKHEHNGLQNTAVISKTPDGHSYQEPYDPESDRVVVNADFNKCNLVIKTVNKTLDEGHWYCNLTKDLSQRERGDPSTDVAKPPRASWYEVTMYRLKVASQTKMVISGPKDKKIRLGKPQMFDCTVKNGQSNPIVILVIRNGTVVLKNTFQPDETNMSPDNVQRAIFEYTATLADTYGTTKIKCITDVERTRVGGLGHANGLHRRHNGGVHVQRLHKIVSLPEIEYQPVLIKSSPNVEEVGRCLRTEEGELSKDSKPQGLSEDHQTNTMVFRSNPLPDLKLLLTNRTDRRVTQSDDEVEIQVNKIDQEHGYEIVVTVDLSGLKDFEQVELEAANEIGTYSARLLCPKANSGPKAQSCSFFNVFSCPESSTYSQLALTVGVVLVIVFIVIGLILCYHISRNRRAWCDRGLLVPEEKPVGQLNRIVVEDANRHGLTGGGGGSAGGGFGAPVPGTLNQINSNPRSQAINHGRITVNPGHHGFENTTIVANIKFGPKGNVLLAGGNDLSNSNTGLDHEYSEISEEFQTASNCPSSKKEDSVIRNTSTDSEEDDIVSSSSEETQSTFIPKLPSQNYLQATTTATIYPRAGGRAGISSGGYAFNPFICDNGDAAPTPDDNQPKQTKPKRPPKKVEVKPPTTNYSRESSTSSDQELDVSFNITYDKLDFDRARQSLRPHYQSSETLKSFKYSTNI